MANKLTRSLPTINTKFVVGALVAAGIVMLTRFLVMRAPDSALVTPIKKVVSGL